MCNGVPREMTSTKMSGLTNEQRKAVFHSKGAACVMAGAGTGKTTALVERIFFLVDDQQIEPKRIIVTTFTRNMNHLNPIKGTTP